MLTAPFPYHGGKRRWAADIWRRFRRPGETVHRYVEPFAGTLAVLLANPQPARMEIVCDTSGHICNFWRALAADPDAVARHADWPTVHHDLTARHAALREWGAENGDRLSEDPDFHDARMAGWWVWGISIWIGGEWCATGHDRQPFVQPSGGGRGSSGQLAGQIPHVKNIPSGSGVALQRNQPKTSAVPGGSAVSQQCRSGPDGVLDGSRLRPWFRALAARLARVVVLNRDWTHAVTPSLLGDTPSSPDRHVRCVLLDPPYLHARRTGSLYGADTDDAALAAFAWAVEHGGRYRIAYCCHEGDFEAPAGWTSLTRTMKGIRDPDRRGQLDMVMFSPACEAAELPLFA